MLSFAAQDVFDQGKSYEKRKQRKNKNHVRTKIPSKNATTYGLAIVKLHCLQFSRTTSSCLFPVPRSSAEENNWRPMLVQLKANTNISKHPRWTFCLTLHTNIK